MDAITGFTFTSLRNLEARGVKAADMVVLPYADNGVKLYGNVIIASPKLIQDNPAAVKAFLQAFTRGVKDVRARDGIINVALETRHLQMAIDTVWNGSFLPGAAELNALPPRRSNRSGDCRHPEPTAAMDCTASFLLLKCWPLL